MRKTVILSIVVGLVLSCVSIFYETPKDTTIFSECATYSERVGIPAKAYTYHRGWPIGYYDYSYCNLGAEQNVFHIRFHKFVLNSALYVLVVGAVLYALLKDEQSIEKVNTEETE